MAVCGQRPHDLERDDLARGVLADFRERERGSGGVGTRARGSLLPAHARFPRCVDHTLLRSDATKADIETLCDEALEWDFAAVCVNGSWVSLCADRLRDGNVRVASVVGFPLGAMPSVEKVREAKAAVDAGTHEIDMVAPIARMLGGEWSHAEDDIRGVVEAAAGRAVKVILETAALTPLQIVHGALVAKRAGARFVKTSTGFHPAGGATSEAVELLRFVVGDVCGVKAAGGIRDCATALAMLAAGATRLGTSSALALARCLDRHTATLSEVIADPARHADVCEMV